MRIRDANWMQVEALLKTGEDRVVLPLGSIEQHAWLSLAVDALLAEAVAVDAAEPLGVPVFPAQPYGYTPTYMAFPGTVTLKLATLLAVLGDIVESLHHHGFRRVLVVNGHGGNSAGASLAQELMARLPGLKLRWRRLVVLARGSSRGSAGHSPRSCPVSLKRQDAPVA